MSITKRISQLLKADVHGVLDCLEEPASIVRQSMREMSEEVEKTEIQGKAVAAKIEDNSSAQAAAQNLLSELAQQVSLCLKERNDDLARAVLRRKLETERRLKILIENACTLEREKKQLGQLLVQQRSQLRQIEERFEVVSSCLSAGFHDGSAITDAEVEIALLKEKGIAADKCSTAESN